jgi:acyl dehydratase
MTTAAHLQGLTGTELGVSAWLPVDQGRVDRHAEVTGDTQWIHNDPDRARREGPFGGPIAQGFLLLALFTELASQALPPVDGLAFLVNYGFDRVRFVQPVLVDDLVRLRVRLAEVRPKGPGQWVLALDADLERASDGAVAVAARWLFLAAEGDRTP